MFTGDVLYQVIHLQVQTRFSSFLFSLDVFDFTFLPHCHDRNFQDNVEWKWQEWAPWPCPV